MNKKTKLKGSCLCGAIKYKISGTPFAAEYCHCRMCQKSVGSVVVNWMDFNIEQVTWIKDQPKEYESSEYVRRGFCAQCGTSISFRDSRYPNYYTLSIASLDDPSLVKPTYHIYVENQVKWLSIDDDCKRFTQGAVKEVT
ncbi:MAG: GFA family protein [Alcanivoracaceae bacterium]|nr:GFA family protein [Alcanivoracaceae bacterium]